MKSLPPEEVDALLAAGWSRRQIAYAERLRFLLERIPRGIGIQVTDGRDLHVFHAVGDELVRVGWASSVAASFKVT